ncbi:hypothetical protein HPP92_000615 [Vanilla planifolia]|uniref:J domain-containing protein n=1 Tax=Vanilla planifolia TaxID=51239 RepID=A0A835S1S4_VANPL|nr:hypothetical protein HPP92_000654 [Vanilla planifolia]KAG0496001.1 hypothetical protein HPP92_000692 [Vanilla planifolia]KAG0500543.1 hypothetical protein HPP92_000615 [Vanilla planifolia]
MDHYGTLGLRGDATKEEIKEAFRRSALDHHPDRHAQSSEDVKKRAAVMFRQASEAYEVLVDDRKRADYDLSRLRGRGRRGWSGGGSPAATPGYGGYGYGSGGGDGYTRRPSGVGVSGFDAKYMYRIITSRGFLISLVFASLLLGGAVVSERGVDILWKMNNSGKSFEDAMKTIEKANSQKENC